ncbi:hypothetical protein HDU67_005246, partial [Dinochytrium kinnereticum]
FPSINIESLSGPHASTTGRDQRVSRAKQSARKDVKRMGAASKKVVTAPFKPNECSSLGAGGYREMCNSGYNQVETKDERRTIATPKFKSVATEKANPPSFDTPAELPRACSTSEFHESRMQKTEKNSERTSTISRGPIAEVSRAGSTDQPSACSTEESHETKNSQMSKIENTLKKISAIPKGSLSEESRAGSTDQSHGTKESGMKEIEDALEMEMATLQWEVLQPVKATQAALYLRREGSCGPVSGSDNESYGNVQRTALISKDGMPPSTPIGPPLNLLEGVRGAYATGLHQDSGDGYRSAGRDTMGG